MGESPNRPPAAGLPSYFGDPSSPPVGIEIRPALAGAVGRASEWLGRPRPVPAAPARAPGPSERSPVFSRMVELHSGGLPAAMQRIFPDGDADATFGALRLERPQPTERGGWVMSGRWRTLLGLRSIPICIEVWPVHDRYCRISLTPRRAVLATRRYFRKGHGSLEQLCTGMGSRPAGMAAKHPV